MGFAEDMVSSLKSIRTGAGAFNPYADTCRVHDSGESPDVRSDNLRSYLVAQEAGGPGDMWLGEAPSYMGMRRTGLPFMPENALWEANGLLQPAEPFRKATRTDTQRPYTANIVWDEARRLGELPFFWNTVMVHTHREGHGLSNRKPTKHEVELFSGVLASVIDHFGFERVVCIGRVAHNHMKNLKVNAVYVRHPSHGGVNKFRSQVQGLYGIRTTD